MTHTFTYRRFWRSAGKWSNTVGVLFSFSLLRISFFQPFFFLFSVIFPGVLLCMFHCFFLSSLCVWFLKSNDVFFPSLYSYFSVRIFVLSQLFYVLLFLSLICFALRVFHVAIWLKQQGFLFARCRVKLSVAKSTILTVFRVSSHSLRANYWYYRKFGYFRVLPHPFQIRRFVDSELLTPSLNEPRIMIGWLNEWANEWINK